MSRVVHTNLVMNKANKLRRHSGKYYRGSMNNAIRNAYLLADRLEYKLRQGYEDGLVNADALNIAYVRGKDLKEMELDYYVQVDPSKVTPKYLQEFLPN